MKITHTLAAAIVLAGTPALVVSFQNGTWDEEPVLTAHSILPSVHVEPQPPQAPQAFKPTIAKVEVARTVVSVPKRAPRQAPSCYTRAVAFNANAGTVRICEPAPATPLVPRTTADLL